MGIELTHDFISNCIFNSQHCQRNWDLSRTIPQEDLDLLALAASQSPSKQNISYYRLHFLTNRDKIQQVYELTAGAIMDPDRLNPVGGYPTAGRAYTNPQTMANLLIVYEDKSITEIDNGKSNPPRNAETYKKSQGQLDDQIRANLERDRRTAIGISAGYVSLVSNLLGYATGFCQCVSDKQAMREVLDIPTVPALLIGVGFSNDNLDRKVHHADHSIVFGSFEKQQMDIKWI
jgi:nitroreductase